MPSPAKPATAVVKKERLAGTGTVAVQTMYIFSKSEE